MCYLFLRLGNIQKQRDFLSNSRGGQINDFRRTFPRCNDGRDIGEITFGRATSSDEPSLPLGSTEKSRSTPMSNQIPVIDGSLFTCASTGSPQQPIDERYRRYLGLRTRLPPDGAFLARGGRSGRIDAQRQRGLCALGTSNRTLRDEPEPRCRCSFGEVERITNVIPAPQPHNLSVELLSRTTKQRVAAASICRLFSLLLAGRALCAQSANSVCRPSGHP